MANSKHDLERCILSHSAWRGTKRCPGGSPSHFIALDLLYLPRHAAEIDKKHLRIKRQIFQSFAHILELTHAAVSNGVLEKQRFNRQHMQKHCLQLQSLPFQELPVTSSQHLQISPYSYNMMLAHLKASQLVCIYLRVLGICNKSLVLFHHPIILETMRLNSDLKLSSSQNFRQISC